MPAIKHDDMLLRLVKDVNEVRSVLRRVVANLPLFDIDNENTPAQLTADQNNYVPGNYDVLRLSGDAARNITGVRNGTKGRRLRIFNVGSYPITLVHASASSLAANRFKFSNAKDAVIPPASTTLIYYDSTQARWIGGDTQSSGAVFMGVSKTTAQGIGPTQTKVDFGTVYSDQYGFYDDANNKIVIKFNGLYQIIATVLWEVTGGGNLQKLYMYVNGIEVRLEQNEAPPFDLLNQTIIYTNYFSANDYVEFYADQDIGPTDINIEKAYLTLTKIS